MINFGEVTRGLDPEEVRDQVNKITTDYIGGMTKMTRYTSKQSVLDEVLGEFKDYGFRLVELDTHLLELYCKDKRIAVYNQTRATIEIIREGCKNFIANTLAQDYDNCYGEELRRYGHR